MNVLLSNYRYFTLLVCLYTSTNILIHVPKITSAKIPSQCYACHYLTESWKDSLPQQGKSHLPVPDTGHCPLGSRLITALAFLYSGCTRYMFTGYLPDWCKLNPLPGATRISVLGLRQRSSRQKKIGFSVLCGQTKPCKVKPNKCTVCNCFIMRLIFHKIYRN